MKRFALFTSVLALGCDMRANTAPPAGEPGDTPQMQRDTIAERTLPPLFATQTGNPPSTGCSSQPAITSQDGCTELAVQTQRLYAAPREISYVDAELASSSDWSDSLIAEDPFSLSYCAVPEQAPRWLSHSTTEPFCLCASALDDMTPAGLGRFGSANDAGRPEQQCGYQRWFDRWLRSTCLYTRDEFPGCSPGVTDSCADTCAVFRERAVGYYAAAHPLQVRRSRFVPNAGDACYAGSCDQVFELDGKCFARRVQTGGCESEPYMSGAGDDCSLSDDELLLRAGITPGPLTADAAAPQCNAL